MKNIFIPKTVKSQISGMFMLEVVNAKTGEITKSTPWMKNIITNKGLNDLAESANLVLVAHVGSGDAVPAAGDTQLEVLVASTSTSITVSQGRTTTAPYYIFERKKYTFGEGVAAGILAEVGVGNTPTGLFSRALIVDETGTPTTITVLSNEFLRVYYEWRIYVPTDDLTGVVTIDEIEYAWTSRPIDIFNNWILQKATSVVMPSFNIVAVSATGCLEAITDAFGLHATNHATSIGAEAYIIGSYEAYRSVFLDLDQGNMNICSIRFRLGWGTWQVKLDPPFLKDNTMKLTLRVKHSWERRVEV